jgi:uncharacterized protein YkwD
MKNKDTEAIILIALIATFSYAYSCLINDKSFFGFNLANLQTDNYPNYSYSSINNKNREENIISIDHLEKTIYEEINAYRAKNNFNTLKLDYRISEIAQKHSLLMLDKNNSIANVDLKTSSELIKEFMPYKSISQAVSYNFGHYNPAQTTANSWIADPRFINTLQGEYEYTGIGVARSVTGEYYFTQIFVNPI